MAEDSRLARVRRAADMIRIAMPEKAAEIDRVLAAVLAGEQPMEAALKIKVGITWKLEKFDGEFQPGKTPVEVIEGTDNL